MKNVLIITASPEENSNSTTMAKAFAEGLVNTNYTIISLNDIPLEFYSYKNKTPHPKTESKFLEVCQKIQSYDGLVIATPTYNFGVPARLKNFIDRIGFIALDYQTLNTFKQPTGQLKHLKTFFIVSGGSPKIAYYALYLFFPAAWLTLVFWYYGVTRFNHIYGAKLTFKNPAKNHPKLLQKCQKQAKKWSQKL